MVYKRPSITYKKKKFYFITFLLLDTYYYRFEIKNVSNLIVLTKNFKPLFSITK